MKLGPKDVAPLFLEVLRVVIQQQQQLIELQDIVRTGRVPPADRVAQTQDAMRGILEQLQAMQLAIAHGDASLGPPQ